MPQPRRTKKLAIRGRRAETPAFRMESLECRACPALVSIAAPASVTEANQTVWADVTLSEALPTQASVTVSASSGTARWGADFYMANDKGQASPSYTLVFAPGQTSQRVPIKILNDALREANETFAVTLSAPRNCGLGNSRSQITILDDDSFTAQLVPPAASVERGSSVEFSIVLSSPATKTEVFWYSVTGITARAGRDVEDIPRRQVWINPGSSSATVRVRTFGDTVVGDQTFRISVTAQTPGLLPPTAYTVTIKPPGPGPFISVNDMAVDEGNDGATTGTFQITLSAPSTRPVTVAYATSNGSATVADNDYSAASGTLNFAPGETSKTVTVSVIGDLKLETDETFSLVLTKPVNGILQRAVGTATIRNDEVDKPGFQIALSFTDPTLPDPTKEIFRRAANRWSQIIVADLPSAAYHGKFTDDFLFEVTIDPTMPSGKLGGATFYSDALRPGPKGLPYAGFGIFNEAYMGAPGIYYTVLHEMAHALGFNPGLWQRPGFALTSGFGDPGASDPRFRGENATREFNTYFKTTGTSVPLDDIHGIGSYGAHWRESVFGASKELMTWAWNVQSTEVDPISKVTIGAMADIGYIVDYFAADRYEPPAAAFAASVAAAAAQSASSPSSSVLPKPILKSLAVPPQPIASTSVLPVSQPTQPVPPKPIVATVNMARSRPPSAPTLPQQLAFAMLVKH